MVFSLSKPFFGNPLAPDDSDGMPRASLHLFLRLLLDGNLTKSPGLAGRRIMASVSQEQTGGDVYYLVS